MKKSYWVIFGIVLFVLVLIIVIGIFLLSNKSDMPSKNQPNNAQHNKIHQIPMEYLVV